MISERAEASEWTRTATRVPANPTRLNQGGRTSSFQWKQAGQTTIEYLVILLTMVGLLVAIGLYMSPRLRNMVKDLTAKIQCALDMGGGCGAPSGQGSGGSGSLPPGGGSSGGSGSPGAAGPLAGASAGTGGSSSSSTSGSSSSSGGIGGSILGGGSSSSSAGSPSQGPTTPPPSPPPPPAPPSTLVFNNPTVNGIPLDHCLNYAKNCGKPAADAYCRSQGFSTATTYTEGANITKTIVPTDGLICDSGRLGYAGCGPMTSVTCAR